MFNRQSIHIAMLLWGAIFSSLAALCMFMSKNFNREKRKRMIWMQLSCAVLLVNDAFAWAFRGDVGVWSYVIVRVSNFFVFLFMDILVFLFHGYACCYLFGENSKIEKNEKDRLIRVKMVFVFEIIGSLFVILSQFINLYYYIDAHNLYHRGSGYFLSFLFPIAGLCIDLSLIIQYRKKISHEIFISLISYIALPYLMSGIQIFYYGISLINISISITMILMFVSFMMEQNQSLARKEKEAADLRISLMLSQIAPHFIYNTLTTIQVLCETDPLMAKETAEDFAGYLRNHLESLSERSCVPFEKELQHVRYYLAIQQGRFGDRIHVVYEIEETDFIMPPLTLQPIVENAVKHGICKTEEGGTITICTKLEDHFVSVIVKDDGIGFDREKIKQDGKSHIGLKNVSERVKSMCNGSFYVKSEPGQGTIVQLLFPQKSKKNYVDNKIISNS